MSPHALVTEHPPTREAPPIKDEIALALSGGGYRAMLFHVGSLWRLFDAGLLMRLGRVSSVSGGSITAAKLALHWEDITGNDTPEQERFIQFLVAPIRQLARKTLDAPSIFKRFLFMGPPSKHVSKAYDKWLFDGKTLQDFPSEGPRFVINTTNVQSGALFRFSKPYAWDWRVGKIEHPTFRIADVVAASSAFPPVLSPFKLQVDPRAFTPGSGDELQREPYTQTLVLSDGGVYDNLGLETCWKNYKTLLVSNAGGVMKPDESPSSTWSLHSFRVLNLIDNQVRSLRKRHLLSLLTSKERLGAYWSIRADIASYGLADPLPCTLKGSQELAKTKTRLKALPEKRQERLINWGYAITDAAIRRYVDGTLPKGSFPYPDAAI